MFLANKLKTSTGVWLDCLPVSGAAIQQTQADIPDPEVPRFFIESQNRWVDNPHHPDYIEAQKRVARERAEASFSSVLKLGCKLSKGLPKNDRWLRLLLRYEARDPLVEEADLDNPESLESLYIAKEAIGSADDVHRIVRACCLCEEEVIKYIKRIGVLRHGVSIDEAGMRHTIQTGIGYRTLAVGDALLVHPSEEYTACTESGLSWWQWRNGEYTLGFMVETIAYYRINRLTNNHTEDARQTEIERKMKKK